MNEKTTNVIARALLVLSVITGMVSFWYTLEFTWTPAFSATDLEIGPTHSNYHAFREAMLALGVNVMLIWALIKGTKIELGVWTVIAFMTFLYYLGWWLPWPIWGFHAPYVAAEINHLIATLGGIIGLAMIKPRGTSPSPLR